PARGDPVDGRAETQRCPELPAREDPRAGDDAPDAAHETRHLYGAGSSRKHLAAEKTRPERFDAEPRPDGDLHARAARARDVQAERGARARLERENRSAVNVAQRPPDAVGTLLLEYGALRLECLRDNADGASVED